MITFMVRMDFTPAEHGQHPVTVLLEDSDGHACGMVVFVADVRSQGKTLVRRADAVMATLHGPGDYALVLLVDQTERKRWPIRLPSE